MLLAPQNLSQLTLNPPASFPELYQELWWWSGGSATTTSTSNAIKLQKGTNGTTSGNSSQMFLCTLSSNWPASTKFALEVTLWTTNASGIAYAQLYDNTASSYVAGTQVSTSSTTATVVRSGQVTLTPGHVYEVALWSSSASYTTNLTDASLIIFPPAGSVSPSLSSISLANPSGGSLKEAYIPLWVYSSSYIGSGTNVLTSGSWFATKGSTSGASSSTDTRVKLHTLNANWLTSQKFAFEASIYTTVSGNTSYAELWDFTAGSAVAGSQISTTSTTPTVIRSGQFTLTPGHAYGITMWGGTSSDNRLTKAHIVALGG